MNTDCFMISNWILSRNVKQRRADYPGSLTGGNKTFILKTLGEICLIQRLKKKPGIVC